MGRPTKLTPEVHRKIVSELRAGTIQELAAARAGIPEGTFYRWLERGAQDGEGIFHEFREDVMRARAEREQRWIEKVEEALLPSGKGHDWRATAWLLERMRPDKYGQSIQINAKVESELSAFLDRAEEQLPSEVFDQLLAIAGFDSREDSAEEAPATPSQDED